MLGRATDVLPVAAAQQYKPAEAVPPAINAFDCFRPQNVKTYDISKHCPALKQEQADQKRVEVYVLQQDFTHRAPGYRCSMTRGTRRFICGSFSYEKDLRSPVGQLPISLSGSDCHRLVSTREYKDEKKKIHPLKVPGVNEVNVDELGWASSIDGDERCQGQRVDIDGHPVDRVVEYSTVMIIIKTEEFVISNGEISAEYSRETLSCSARQGKCSGALHAYTWNLLTVTPCPWKISRTSNGFLADNVYFSKDDGILFELGLPSSDIRCPGLHVRHTGYEDLAIVETRPNLPRLASNEVRVTLWFRVFQEFVIDTLEQLSSTDRRTYSNLQCEDRSNNEKPGTLRALGNGKFARRMGDTHVEFDCPAIEVNLREDVNCYTAEIPVQNTRYPFVTVANRVLTTVGTPSPCLDDYPLRVKGTHGWWRLLPHIEADVPPRTRITVNEPAHHQFDRQAGLYSVGELRQWQHLQEVPHYQRLLTTNLAQGVCAGIDSCALTPVPGAPAYTLANLEADALEAVTPQWIETLLAVLHWGGLILAWLSLAGWFLLFRRYAGKQQKRGLEMFPLNIHTSSVTTPSIPSTIVTTNLQPGSIEEIPPPVIEARHAGALLGPGGVHHRDGGCKDATNTGYRIRPGPSKMKSRFNPSLTPESA